jgi:hypothetical protein
MSCKNLGIYFGDNKEEKDLVTAMLRQLRNKTNLLNSEIVKRALKNYNNIIDEKGNFK